MSTEAKFKRYNGTAWEEITFPPSSHTHDLIDVYDEVTNKDLVQILNEKLDKVTIVTSYPRIYAKAPNGTQTTITAVSLSTADTLIIRDANGNAEIAMPTSNNHIANKKYVDDNLPKVIR